MVSRVDVFQAYRHFLGREPESEDVILAHQVESTLDDLGRRLMRSDEFRRRLLRDVIPGSKPKWVCAEIRYGLKLWVDLNDIGVSAGCLRDDWEQSETDLILSLLCPGDTFIDVGANIGWFTILAAHKVGPNGRVYAFEPRSDRYERLVRSVVENGFEARCIVEKIGLGSAETELDLGWIPEEHNPGHSFLMTAAQIEGSEWIETVRVAPLDSYGIDQTIKVMKIDVEGAEPGVIEGARALIARDHPVLLLEIFPRWLSAVSKTTADIFLDDIRNLGYRIHRLTTFGLGRELHLGDDGVESGHSEYFTIVALSEADHARLLAHRIDHRVDDLERRLRTMLEVLSRSEARGIEAKREAEARVAAVAAQAAEAREAAEAVRREAEARVAGAAAQTAEAREAAEAARREAEARVAAAAAQAAEAREAAEAVRREAEARVAGAAAQTAEAREAAEAARREAEAKDRAIYSLSQDLGHAKGSLYSMEVSTLWRATAPLRRIGDALPKGSRRLIRRTARLSWWIVTFQAPRRLREYWSRTNAEPPPPLLPDEAPPPLQMAAPSPTVVVPPFWGTWFVVPHSHGPSSPPRLPTPSKPRVLIIDGRWPRPDRDSGSVDAVMQAYAFHRFGYEVVFAADAEFAEASFYRDQLESAGIICLSSTISPSIESFLHSDGATLAVCVLSRVYGGGRYLEAVRHHAPRAMTVFNTVDLHHLREIRAAELAADITALRRAEAVGERELYIVRQSDATIVVSAAERAVLADKVPGAMVFEMPLARPIRPYDLIPSFGARTGIGFVGGFDHDPNVDAIMFFLNEIWPLVRRELPDVQLSIVGAHLPDSVLASMPCGVSYLGPIPDLDPWFDSLRLTIAPLRYGAGAKGKVVSSLAAGVPCVGTMMAMEGMGLQNGINIALGDTPALFAAQVIEVYREREVWACLSVGGHAKAINEFSITAGETRLAAMLDDLGILHHTTLADLQEPGDKP